MTAVACCAVLQHKYMLQRTGAISTARTVDLVVIWSIPLAAKLPGFGRDAPLAEAADPPLKPPSRPRFPQKPQASILIFGDALPWPTEKVGDKVTWSAWLSGTGGKHPLGATP